MKPYTLMLHYDPTLAGATAFISTGAICGQPQEVAATPRPELVECQKCLRILRKVE